MASSLSPLPCLRRIPTSRHFVSTKTTILGTTNTVLKHATSRYVSATATLGRRSNNINNNNTSTLVTKSFGSRHKRVPRCFNQQQQQHHHHHHCHHPNSYYRFYSAPTTHHHEPFDDTTPQGDLFEAVRDNNDDDEHVFLHHSSPCPSWVGQSGRIKRTFGAQANAESMLLCGGAALAAHASFDPHYARAATWIHNHAVGPAVLNPVLTSGLISTLTQAAFPQSVPLSQSMEQIRPLVVGVSVYATITVQRVTSRVRGCSSSDSDSDETSPDDTVTDNDKDANGTSAAASVRDAYAQQGGFQIDLQAVVSRVRDEVVISQGTVSIWLADLQQHHNADHVV